MPSQSLSASHSKQGSTPIKQVTRASGLSESTQISPEERQRILNETLGRYYEANTQDFLREFFPGASNVQFTADEEAELLKWWPRIQKQSQAKKNKTAEVEDGEGLEEGNAKGKGNGNGKGKGNEEEEEEETRKIRSESDMYPLLTKFMGVLLRGTELKFLDVHLHSDEKRYDGHVSSRIPDFMAVKKDEVEGEMECCGGQVVENRMCWRHCHLVADAKFRNDDPFDTSNWSTRISDTLGQVLHYLLDVSQFQHRVSSYLILFFHGGARIIRWSPREIVFNERFQFVKFDHFMTFCRFVRFYGSHAADRGFDHNFTRLRPTDSDAEGAASCFQRMESMIKQAGFALIPEVTDLWRVNIPDSASAIRTKDISSTNASASSLSAASSSDVPPSSERTSSPHRTMVVGRIGRFRTSLCGRNGKYFLGWAKTDPDSIYFVKASWSYTGDGRVPESDIYNELMGQPHIQRMICGGHPEGSRYTAKTPVEWTVSQKPELRGEGGEETHLEQRLHLLVLPFVRPLFSFKNGYELLIGLLGGLQGLLALHKAGYLHRDISDSNIALSFPGKKEALQGLLQDFDFAIKPSEKRDRGQRRTGTYIFIAAELLSSQSTPDHELIHDIESCYHILTIYTYFHLSNHDSRRQNDFLEDYFGKTSAAAKEVEIYGNHHGYREEDVRGIPVLGDLILLFRQFLRARYEKQPDILDFLASVRKQKIRNLCSKRRLNIDVDDWLECDIMNDARFENTQELVLEFLIAVLQLIIKGRGGELKQMKLLKAENCVDEYLRLKRKGAGLQSERNKKRKLGTE